MAVHAGPPCRPPVLLLLLLLLLRQPRPTHGARVSTASASALPRVGASSWRPPLRPLAESQPPTSAPTAGQSPKEASPAQTSPSPVARNMTPRQTRVFPLFEYLTPNGRFIPGLAKNSHCCGKENMFEIFVGARIVGGEVTTPFQYPWMVAIVLAADVPTRTEMGKDFAKTGASEKEERHISLPICGGALLNDRYVVTSSECVAPHSAADIVVMLGKFLSSTDPERYTFNVVQIIRHADLNPSTKENDIALLKMETILSLPLAVNYLAPICLPHRSKYTDEIVTVTGYGFLSDIGEPSSTLRTVDLRTISNSECGDYLGEDTIEKSMICAGAKIVGEGGAGPCTYDLGGPLIIRTWYDRDRFTLIGIATNRTGCGQPGVPAVFTRVYSFLDWLLDNMEDAVYC